MKTGPLEPILDRPEEIIRVSGTMVYEGYSYVATRRDGGFKRLLTSRRRYKWFHQWRCFTASNEAKIIHYFSTSARAAPVPAYVPGRAQRLEPISIVYV
jgi:hypothetical protein